MQLRADFHTHAIGEGVFGPRSEELVARHLEAALEVGLDCIAVTDHNDLRPGLLAQDYAARHGLRLLVFQAWKSRPRSACTWWQLAYRRRSKRGSRWMRRSSASVAPAD